MKFAKILTAALSAAILLSSAAVPAFAEGKISYTFTGDEKSKPGYAEGKITLSGFSGEEHLFWADDNKALDGFYEIAKTKDSFRFGEHTVIPPDATKIIAVSDKSKTKVSEADAVFEIPAEKRLSHKSSDANYTFMNYSDIHIDESENKFYDHSELHWQKALETAAARKADFIITAGDNITNDQGPGKEFDKFQQILSESDFVNPVYEGSGNHELRTGKKKALISAFINATGLDGKEETIAKNKPYYFVEEPNTGDLFIFMALEMRYNPAEGDEFSDEQLNWLSSLLKEHYGKNRNIFLIQHALIEGYGAGDDEDNYYTVPLGTKYKSTQKFRDIISAYPELVWISGHTHIALSYGYNYSNMNDTSCHMIHDSSVCCPTKLNYASHNLSYSNAQGDENKDKTEGYYTQVFDDEVIFYGENLYYDKIYPASSYILESCRKSLEPKKDKKPVREFRLSGSDALCALCEQAILNPKTLSRKNVTAADVEQLRTESKELLGELYSFSSFDKYQALKKLVYQNGSGKDYYSALAEAYTAVMPYTRQGFVSVYFTNANGWKTPYARLSSSKHNNGNGEKMVFVKKDSDGKEIYKIDVNCRKYSTIQFSDGTDNELSEPQTLTGEDNKLYVLNDSDPTSPYYCYLRDFE